MVDVTELVKQVSFVRIEGASSSPLELALVFAEDWRAHLAWERDDAALSSLRLTAALPAGEERKVKVPRIRLAPQKGVVAAVGALSEIKLEEADVDDAFVIHADDPALLVAMIPELRALAPIAPHIVVDDSGLEVTFGKIGAADVARAVEGALALWHRTLFFLIATL